MKHTDVVEILKDKEYVGKEVTVCGWVRTARDSKNMAFIELNDGTCLKHIQLVIDKETFTKPLAEFSKLGAAIKVIGTVVPSAVAQDGGVEINVQDIELLGPCPEEYPLQKKRTSLDTLRTMPHLRVRTNTFNAVFRVRSVLAQAIHNYFQERHYVYVNTPIITGSDCEGAGEMFTVTTHKYEDARKYKTEAEYYADDFFGKSAGLSVSGQLEGEVAAMAFGKIYTFGPSFRAENSNTTKHVAEFWHVEPEVAFAELPDIIEIAEDMIKHITKEVLEKCPAELDFFEKFFEPGLKAKLQHVIDSDFEILDYTKAIDILKDAQEKDKDRFKFPVEWGCDL
ncbi:MAG: asparagine--tRNA ligase, partial [Clostridia bacterium]|nr:asparagine--tRNA ligase [Clostridia bacterium]